MKPKIIRKETYSFHGLPLHSFLDEKGGLWFEAYETCQGLGLDWLNDVRKRKYIKCNDRKKQRLPIFKNGQNRRVTILHESLVYKLVSVSEKPEAVEFCDWIYDEVVPSIRKHGMYIEGDLLEDYQRLCENFQNLLLEYNETKASNDSLKAENALKASQIAFLEEKTRHANSVCVSQIASPLEIDGEKANKLLQKIGCIKKYIYGWDVTPLGREYGFSVVGSDGNYYVRYELNKAAKVYALLKEALEQEG